MRSNNLRREAGEPPLGAITFETKKSPNRLRTPELRDRCHADVGQAPQIRRTRTMQADS